MRWVALVLLAAACWRSEATPPPPLVPEPLLERSAPSIPARTVWVGFYECAQGRTAVSLTIATSASGSARAVFEFGPHEDNPDIPQGKYRLTGTFREDDDGRLELTLQPQRWIEQPPGYSMTAVSARSDSRRRRLVGRILSERCGGIVVERRR